MARRPAAPDPALTAARQAIVAELVRRRRLPTAVEAMEANLFGPQRAFVYDDAPRVVTDAGRRAGKTTGLGTRILRIAAAYPGATIPVFERTQTCEAARVLWKSLQELDQTYALNAGFHHSRFIVTLPNKAEVVLMSADTIEACDKARGGKFPAAFVDEAGTLRDHVLRYLLESVLGPTLLDHGGSLTMAGTPKVPCQGPFADACKPNSGYSHHHWTFLENDALPLNRPDIVGEARRAWRLAQLEAELRRTGRSMDDAAVQREWMGLWRDDGTSNVYRIRPSNYADREAPPEVRGWNYVIGLDVGWNDPCAFVVVAWSRSSPELWVLESFEEAKLLTDGVAGHLERLRARYPRARMVMDAGSHGGKVLQEGLMRHHGLWVEAAAKRGKFDHIAFLNSAFSRDRVRIVHPSNRELVADLQALRYAPPAPDGTVREAEHPADDNHLPDALLYAVTAITGYAKELGEAEAPARGSAEWARRQEAAWLEADAARHAEGDGGLLGVAESLLDGTL